MAHIYIQHPNGRGGEWVWFNEAQARAQLGIPQSAPTPSAPPVVATAGGAGCLGVLAVIALFFSSLFGCNKEEPSQQVAVPSPTPVVQAQMGYAPRAELVRLPHH